MFEVVFFKTAEQTEAPAATRISGVLVTSAVNLGPPLLVSFASQIHLINSSRDKQQQGTHTESPLKKLQQNGWDFFLFLYFLQGQC